MTAAIATRTGREIHLVARPRGLPTAADFTVAEVDLGPLMEHDVLVRNHFLSVDPYMRGRMNEGPSYVSPFALGTALDGGAVGEVIESRSTAFQPGDFVTSFRGWRDSFIAPSAELQKVAGGIWPVSISLGALGMTGMTAWAGLRLADVTAGDVVYVSGAAGAVGSVAGQLARLHGCRVIGSAGSAAKVAFLTSTLGFDAAFNYHDGPVHEQLQRVAPDGIDVYFDNVGGEALQGVLAAMRTHGRIVACGGIAAYNDPVPKPGPSNLFLFTTRRLTMKGLIIGDWLDRRNEFEAEVGDYVRSGKLKPAETLVKGLDHAVEAFIGLFSGRNTGKMIVDLT